MTQANQMPNPMDDEARRAILTLVSEILRGYSWNDTKTLIDAIDHIRGQAHAHEAERQHLFPDSEGSCDNMSAPSSKAAPS